MVNVKKINILLIQSPCQYRGMTMIIPPLGLASIAAVLEKNGFNVKILDAFGERLSFEELKERLKKIDYDIIGITALTATFYVVVKTAKIVKEINPNCKVIIGGPHATVLPEKILKENKEIDVVVIGEGEYTFLDLVKNINKNLNNVKGIAYRGNNRIIITKPRELSDLNDLPIPSRHLLNMNLYRPSPTFYKELPTHHLIVTRGCPNQCIYCSKIFGNYYRKRKPELVLEEIKILINKYGAKGLLFLDDLLTCDKEWLHKICDLIIKERIKVKWCCQARVNMVDESLLRKMKRAGCWSVSYGIESSSNRILNLIKKNINTEQVRKAFEITNKVGIDIEGFFMFGLPGDTKQSCLNTLKFAKELDPDTIQFALCTPFPGTELEKIVTKYGTITMDYKNFNQIEVSFVPYGMTKKELLKLQRIAYVKFFFNFKHILKMIRKTRNINDIKRYLVGLEALLIRLGAKKFYIGLSVKK